MELMWLEDFLALARGESFSRAAETRGVTQPAFSRRIRALETWLGVVLVDRDTHRISLTAAGSRFVEVADATLRTLEHGRREVREIAGASQSSLRITATHALSLTFFPSWVRSIEALSAQEVSIQLTADNMAAAEQTMLQGRAQFLLCHHHPAAATVLDQRNFACITLGSDRLVPVSTRTEGGEGPLHALPGTESAPVSTLEYGPESGMGRIVAAARAAGGPVAHLSSVFRSHAVLVLTAMAREGKGVAWLPESLVAEDIAAGRLVLAGDDAWSVPMEIRLYRPRARQSPAAEGFWALASAGPKGNIEEGIN
ncbi:LysR substrate-binding domain-containing protein [Sphingomonas oryzagri]|uniref:LysR substrate-binding domain-containing protein n=1 Tax=Sphingomonas oryzagri TaxID=3042314 RepID=A0ABT6MZV7_9SPHN|nr:LysR substrate-binding domain-containing protein [Sphingomonas oryzagri]MDH7637626.1 LysR substrate-binding domain-containing protein [Sphingomonas oryzagri]